ncbi:MAG: flippase-like domain-containing protein [Planctomycetes bacterium]|nr:flippase-like domain-containing protein [Planctomycetota bacterium]
MTEGMTEDTAVGLPALVGRIWNVGKWLIVAAAVGWLWREGTLALPELRPAPGAGWRLAAAAGCLAVATAAVGVRFHRLLRCLDCPSSLAGQIRIVFSGLLAQQAGSDAAFDVMRGVAARNAGGGGPEIIAALMADRLLGLFALTAIAVAGLSIVWSGGGWLAASLVLIVILAAAPALLALGHSARRSGALPWLWRLPGSRFLAAVGGAVKRYRHRWRALPGLFLLSLAGHGATFAALYCSGTALAGVDLTPAEAVVGGALATFTGVLPLPLAGLGVGETAFGLAVSAMRGGGEPLEFSLVFLVNRLILLAFGAAAWVWLALARGRSRPVRPPENAALQKKG